ncbi:hypothetical protein BVX97_05200 [bacterium E08(2017)]|nr:hypothetical protein BVX97_05200 [bacterium E08(2017)]
MTCQAKERFSKDSIQQLIAAINQKYDMADSLHYEVQRSTTSQEGTVKDSWTFSYLSPSSIRIDYGKPSPRLIIITRNEIWEYLEEPNAAMRTDLSGSSQSEHAAAFSNVIMRVAIPGLKPGTFDQILSRKFKTSFEDPILTVHREKAPKFKLKIDTEREILLLTEIYNKDGQLEIKSSTSKHKEVAPGFWFPQQIKNTMKTDIGFVSSQVQLSNIAVNRPFPKKHFIFNKPNNLKLIEK